MKDIFKYRCRDIKISQNPLFWYIIECYNNIQDRMV